MGLHVRLAGKKGGILDKIRDTLVTGRPTFGSWIAIADSVAAEVLGKAGYDWAILDTQHGGVGWDDLLPMLQALDLGGTAGLVRTGWNDAAQIMRALDLGAAGVIVPMVSTPEQALAAAQAVRYPPHGIRSFGPVRNYYAASGAAPREPLCFVMIETAEAMDNLDAITATPGVDGLFVGPVDLALSLGLGPALTMPEQVFSAIGDVIAACQRHGKIPGAAALGLANAQALAGHGLKFITISSDIGLLRRGAAADLSQARSWPNQTQQG
jgi:4-hydroxy-2-oxoheptanedioate aldolase